MAEGLSGWNGKDGYTDDLYKGGGRGHCIHRRRNGDGGKFPENRFSWWRKRICATSKSHRGSKDREIIRFDNDESHIKVNVKKNDMNYRIDMHLKKNKPKGIAVNGIPIKRAVELFGILNIVFFSPEDLNIIKNGPSERRRFIDMELSQLDKIYLDCLINYNKVVNQRNSLLKEYAFSGREDIISSLDIWDMQLVKYGNDVIKSREKFVKEINDLVKSIHTKLSGDREQLEIIYEPCVKEQDFESELVRVRDRDLKFKCTNIGPHKDDMCFLINGMDVRKYGSQGQQRTAALSLKLAEIELVKQIVDIDLVGLFDIDPIIGHPDFFGHKFYAVQISLHIQISHTFIGRICIKSYLYVNIPNDNRPFCLFLERCKYSKMIVSVLFYCRKFLIAVENSFIVYISSLCV